jgi:hypothetical protein
MSDIGCLRVVAWVALLLALAWLLGMARGVAR